VRYRGSSLDPFHVPESLLTPGSFDPPYLEYYLEQTIPSNNHTRSYFYKIPESIVVHVLTKSCAECKRYPHLHCPILKPGHPRHNRTQRSYPILAQRSNGFNGDYRRVLGIARSVGHTLRECRSYRHSVFSVRQRHTWKHGHLALSTEK
jgi:hypothetical protein